MLFGSLFVRRGLLLLSTDNMLDCFRQLGNVTALYILTDLCSALQIIKVRILIGEHKNCLVIHIRAHQQSLISCIIQVRGYCQDAQTNRAGQLTNRGLVDDLIIREVIFPVFEFLTDVQIPKDNLRDRLNNSSAIYGSIADISFNILLIVRQEGIGISVSRNIVLRNQTIQRLLNRLTHVDLVSTDIIHHKGRDVIYVGLNIINISDQIQKL